MIENPILKKLEDESFMDYHMRLYDNMSEYGTDKYINAELLNKEFGSSYDESKWRKDYALFTKFRDYMATKNLDEEVTKKYEEIRIESEKEKIRNQDQKREYKKLIRNQARFEKIKDDIYAAVLQLESKKPITHSPSIIETSNKEGLVLLSDWHFGMDIDNYSNKFNKQIFNHRVNELLNKTIEYGKQHDISTLHVANLGDLVGGLIHVSTRVQANEDVVEQTKYVSETLAEFLSELANTFPNIKYYNVAGNHGRTSPSKNDVGIKENFEYLIPWYLEARLRKFDNIEINNEQDGFIIGKILNEDVVFTHGHYDRPDQSVTKIPQLTGIIPSYIFSGHIHHHYEKEYGRTTVIVNGSLVGNDDYAMQGRFGSKPSQKFMVFNDDGLECSYIIKFKTKGD
ncbi:hypothetical protein [Metabacillus fastidiosus]|uniref:hypothetical protein n=1 Tax=Metabacillus fastidiosus TaxID=1458 RepID=UPI003D2829F6